MASVVKNKDGPNDQFKCSVCLSDFVRPKLLPCSHTFCEPCLSNLVQKSVSRLSFACPYCRERVNVPRGGVSSFKNNIYLNQEPASKEEKSRKAPCTVHPDRDIELLCLQCEACICLKCKVEYHIHHNTEDVAIAVERIRVTVSNDKPELDKAIADLQKHMQVFRSEQNSVFRKNFAIKEEIRKRHRMMVAVADRCREEALLSLDTVTTSIHSQTYDTVNKMEKTLDDLTKLSKRIERCQNREADSRVLVDVQDIYQDASKQKNVLKELMATRVPNIARPVLRFSSTASATLGAEQRFLGTVVRVDMSFQAQSVNIKKLFQCPVDGTSYEGYSSYSRCQDVDDYKSCYEVFSLFPRGDDTVWLAYEMCFVEKGSQEKHPELFKINGTLIRSEAAVAGKVSFTHSDNGTEVHTVHSPEYFGTFAKSRNPFELRNNLQGSACLMGIMADKECPSKTQRQPLFMFCCGLHRAFDADKNNQLCAVVEEAQPPSSQRKVHIYQQPTEFPVATYCSPFQPFQPSDVCFYRLGCRQVLLVSDELNDAIHVVHLENGRAEFGGYLAPGCDLLTQPTALNTDCKGRLWVACRPGNVLLYQPPAVGVDDLTGSLNRVITV